MTYPIQSEPTDQLQAEKARKAGRKVDFPKQRKTKEIETGDFVTVIGGERDGWSGILDNIFVQDGVTMFTVVSESDDEDFVYATEIKAF